jgi:hypothetical protein
LRKIIRALAVCQIGNCRKTVKYGLLQNINSGTNFAILNFEIRQDSKGTVMIRKTLSQKMARIFEIVNYPLGAITAVLIAIATIYFPVLIFYMGLPVILWILGGWGLFLAIRYINHSRGALDEEKALPMWVGTIIFNALLLFPNLYLFSQKLVSADGRSSPDFGIWTIIRVSLMVWWTLAIILSVAAIWSDERQNRNENR